MTLHVGTPIRTVTSPPSDALQTFLRALYPTDDGFIEVRLLPSTRQIFVPVGDAGELAAVLNAHADEHCYVGVAARRTAGNGRLENCAELWTVFLDLDFKTLAEAEARTRLMTCPIPPHVIVHSGGGLHCYWRLREPFALPADADRAKSLLRRLAQHFGGDLASAEPVRVLRAPGSWNHKYTPPRPVVLERVENGAVNVGELDEWLPADAAPRRPNGSSGEAQFSVPPVIRNGSRNDLLYRSARSLHAKGWSAPAIHAALTAENVAKCDPPLPQDEVDQIADHAATQADRPDFAADARRGRLTAPVAAVESDDTDSAQGVGVALEDFYAYMPMHTYIFPPSREVWPAASVNGRFPRAPLVDEDGCPVIGNDGKQKTIRPSAWLDQHRPVEQMTWAPGRDVIIPDRLVSDGGWVERVGCSCFNLYRPPLRTRGDASQAGRWLDHVHRVYPDDSSHIVSWLAHRVQWPHEKINHALVLGGLQGIGKDTLLEPVKAAVGPWNFFEVSPSHVLGRFNGFVKSVILRVSEARDLGEVDRYAFYEHLKIYTAAPPDVLRVDEKNLREHYVWNVCGVILTTNHKSDGLHLPADDRRHYVTWSNRTKEDFDPAYWTDLHQWYAGGGDHHVAAYLAGFDLTGFDPKAPPPKTSAFWEIVDANRAPEDAELADALDTLGRPNATTLGEIIPVAAPPFSEWLRERRNGRQIPHRLETAGYAPVRNPDADDGLWRVSKRRQVIYARQELSPRDRLGAARHLIELSQ